MQLLRLSLLMFLSFFSANVSAIFTAAIDRKPVESLALYYYNSKNTYEQLVPRVDVNLTNFQPDRPTKLIIHGYLANRFHSAIAPLKNAYMATGNVNLLVVDWQQGAFQLYDKSRSLVPFVGQRVAEILSLVLRAHAVDMADVHVIGHSLGAHIAGNVGRYFDGKLGRITGLDPALPLFLRNSPDSLTRKDASFVDCIHTCGGLLGEVWTRGDVDFYPNSGLPSQPGCQVDDFATFFACSHYKAPQFFAESILTPTLYMATECSLDEILKDTKEAKCETLPNSRQVFMGERVPRSAQGTYYLETNSVAPFGMGNSTRRNLF